MTPTQRNFVKPAVLRLMAVTGSVLLVLVIAELGLRLLGGDPWYEILPAQQRLRAEYAFVVGGEEFFIWHPPLDLPKLGGRERILFIGDSFIYGSGVKEPEAFASLVTHKLNEESAELKGPLYETFNAGIPASMTSDWAHLFDAVA
ncbi:hypothetical protein MK280_06025 [Myxococcota bacterium]|nr:hypothetical protein [Myxococcota bacterium]